MNYHKEMSLKEWSQMFRDIYYPAQNYGRSSFEIFTHLVKVFGAGSHYLFREHDPKGSREYLAKVFAWYCALANRLHLDIEDALWQKYPNVCPRCLKSSCQCEATINPIDAERLSIIAIENHFLRPSTLREWQTMFAGIYKGPSGKEVVSPNRDRIALIFSRIAEELGEVAEALSLDSAVDSDRNLVVKNEMADLGAWIFALANNLHLVDPVAHGAYLVDITWELYPGKCHRCQEDKCICVHGAFGLELAEKGAMAPSHWDERTGLANDKALRRYLKYANTSFSEGNYLWAIIFLDLDNFGALNKTYSHAVGDEVLRIAAQRISESIGKSGIAFRRGGEEFTIVARLSKDPALLAAEKIRKALADAPFIVKNGEETLSISVTGSLGVAEMFSSGATVKVPEDLEAVADSRCAEAKITGKNKIVPTLPNELVRGELINI